VARNELGIVYRRTGRFEQARESYERALDEYPDFHFARLNLAILCDTFLEDLSCAVEQYERYLQSVPDDEDAAMWVADLRNRIGR
jgi:tetratricopeptide (TPR) repeat protein